MSAPATLTPASTLPPGSSIRPSLSRDIRRHPTDKHHPNALRFRIQRAPVCVANAIRRVLLNDIPCVVFRCFPDDQNQVVFEANTMDCSQHNELIKHRLQCIPIYVRPSNTEFLERYTVSVDETNHTDEFCKVRTENFRLRDNTTGQILTDEQMRALSDNGRPVFPPNVTLAILRPKVQRDILGDALKFSARMSVSTAGHDGAYAVAIVAMENTPDEERQAQELVRAQQQWLKEDERADVAFRTANWRLLDARRIFLPNDYQLTVRAVGVYSNQELVLEAIRILRARIHALHQLLSQADAPARYVSPSKALERGLDVALVGERHTIGELLRHYIHHFCVAIDAPTVAFVGFHLDHPHQPTGTLRIQLVGNRRAEDTVPDAMQIVRAALQEAQQTFVHLETEWRREFMNDGRGDHARVVHEPSGRPPLETMDIEIEEDSETEADRHADNDDDMMEIADNVMRTA